MNIRQAHKAVSKIRQTMPEQTYVYYDAYREQVTPRINYKPAIFTVCSSLLMIVGLFAGIYFLG